MSAKFNLAKWVEINPRGRNPVFRAVDDSMKNVSAEAKSIENGTAFASGNDKAHEPPIPFSQLITVQGMFGFVRDILEKKVDHAITPIVLVAQSDEPDLR